MTVRPTRPPVQSVTITHFAEKKFETLYGFLKVSKDLLSLINGKSINWTPSEILRVSLRGINIRLSYSCSSHSVIFFTYCLTLLLLEGDGRFHHWILVLLLIDETILLVNENNIFIGRVKR